MRTLIEETAMPPRQKRITGNDGTLVVITLGEKIASLSRSLSTVSAMRLINGRIRRDIDTSQWYRKMELLYKYVPCTDRIYSIYYRTFFTITPTRALRRNGGVSHAHLSCRMIVESEDITRFIPCLKEDLILIGYALSSYAHLQSRFRSQKFVLANNQEVSEYYGKGNWTKLGTKYYVSQKSSTHNPESAITIQAEEQVPSAYSNFWVRGLDMINAVTENLEQYMGWSLSRIGSVDNVYDASDEQLQRHKTILLEQVVSNTWYLLQSLPRLVSHISYDEFYVKRMYKSSLDHYRQVLSNQLQQYNKLKRPTSRHKRDMLVNLDLFERKRDNMRECVRILLDYIKLPYMQATPSSISTRVFSGLGDTSIEGYHHEIGDMRLIIESHRVTEYWKPIHELTIDPESLVYQSILTRRDDGDFNVDMHYYYTCKEDREAVRLMVANLTP